MAKSRAWEVAEDEFYKAFNQGKDRYCHRFLDTRDATRVVNRREDLFGRKVVLAVPPQPSDFIVIWHGNTYFVDVKATSSEKGISSSLFKQQKAQKTKILNAGGKYFFFVNRITTCEWYMIPGDFKNLNAKWKDLEEFKVDIWAEINI